jgi:hypothetical protein
MKKELLLKRLHSLNKTKQKNPKDSDYWFSLVNALKPFAAPNPWGPPTLGCPQPMGPPTQEGPQPMGAAITWGPYPWGFPSFVGTSPLGPLSRRTLGTPNFRAPKPWGPPSLGGPRAFGAPRPGLVGLVGNPPLALWNSDFGFMRHPRGSILQAMSKYYTRS